MRRVLLGLLVFAMVFSNTYVFGTERAASEVVLYVSPSGNDFDAGTQAKPLATLDGARARVRTMSRTAAIRVVFAEGTYRFDKTAAFTIKDSGTAEYPITYEAAPGAEVIFSGARKLDASKIVPVTDEKILSRLPASARTKVGQLDLRRQGIAGISALALKTVSSATSAELPELFINGKRQMLAQWPNGDGNYSKWASVVSIGASIAGYATENTEGGAFKTDSTNPLRWGEAKEFFIGGYPGYDYRYERIQASVDVGNATLIMKNGSDFGFINQKSNRWKAFNLLEEIDAPGEWYIDRDSMILYLFPPYSLAGADMELSLLDKKMVVFDGTDYVSFKGIHFTKTRETAVSMNTAVGINITGCTFSYIGKTGIETFGQQRGSIMYRTFTDASYNCNITNNNFMYMGSTAVKMHGGNTNNLEPGNNHISNNYIYSVCELSMGVPAIDWLGAGDYIENNYIHNLSFHAINYYGHNVKIRYNEIHNVCKDVNDAGAIYTGRSYIQRNNEISYNFIYNYLPVDDSIGSHIQGIYLDDCVSGGIVHHNILMNGTRGVFIGGGQFNNVYNNIIIDMEDRAIDTSPRGEVWDLSPWTEASDELRWALSSDIYVRAFPTLLETGKRGPEPPIGNSYIGNLSNMNIFIDPRVEELSAVGDNYTLSTDDLVNAGNLDFRIKDDSPLAKVADVLTESNFNLDMFGMTRDVALVENPGTKVFRKLYPQNGDSNVDSKEIILLWEEVQGADGYTVKIASDPQMQDVVLEGNVSYNNMKVTALEHGNKTYYWTVDAVQKSRKGSTWKSTGVPYMFTTAKYQSIDKYTLGKAIETAESEMNKMVIGDSLGNYPEEAKQFLAEEIQTAKTVYTKSAGQIMQADVDNAKDNVISTLAQIANKVVIGYNSVEALIGGSPWAVSNFNYNLNMKDEEVKRIENAVSMVDEAVVFSLDGVSAAQMYASEPPEKNSIFCFSSKIDFPKDTSWIGFSMRHQDPKKVIWDTKGYLVTVKENIFELQVFPSVGYSSSIIQTAVNNIVRNGEWHDYQFGVIDVAGGIRLLFKVDGRTVFDYYDETAQIPDNGSFAVYNSSGHTVSVKAPESLPTGNEEENMPGGTDEQREPQVLNLDGIIADSELRQFIRGNVSDKDGGIVYQSDASGADAFAFVKMFDGSEIFNFDAVFNPGISWQGISLRTSGLSVPWENDNYLFVVKKDTIELQRFHNTKNEILAITDNKYITDGKRANIQVGAVSDGGNVRLMMYVDGKKVFDIADANPIPYGGYLSFYDFAGAGIELYGGTGETAGYSRSISAPANGTKGTVYTTASPFYTEIGGWTAGTAGYNGEIMRESTKQDASARWDINLQGGIYKIYYWVGLQEGGDSNAELKIVASAETRRIPINFSKGESGWRYVGVSDPSDGKLNIFITPQSGGRILTSAVRVEAATEEERALSKLFDLAPTAIVLKTGAKTAYASGQGFLIPDVVPLLDDGKVMVPLRFITESLGAGVVWDDSTNTAVITVGSHTLAVTVNEKTCLLSGEPRELEREAAEINGRLMLPVRDICEMLDKDVLWTESGLIVITEKGTADFGTNANLLDFASRAFE